MYDNPLCIYREYIQNSADAIDAASRACAIPRSSYEIRITIEPREHRIEISDNGFGLAAEAAERILVSVGDSDKFGNRERGFRGIGRLGGVAYCESLRFRAKAAGEKKETVSRWDCQRIKQLLSPSNRPARSLTLQDLIEECVDVERQDPNCRVDESYFKVELENVRCVKNVLLDARAVSHYLSQVAPVPFDNMRFSYGDGLHDWLNKVVPNYSVYRVYLNGEEILKPYSQTVTVRKGQTDEITDVVKFDITDQEGKAIAHGWRGIRRMNLAQLSAEDGVDGIRIRVGNILLGDKSLLDGTFQEARFNKYNVGEIHVVDPGLVPNARRDNFEDGDLKSAFFTSVERDLAVPLRKTIRDGSKKNAARRPIKHADEAILLVNNQSKKGFVSEGHKKEAIKDLRGVRSELEGLQKKRNTDEEIKDEAGKRLGKIDDLVNTLEECKPDITAMLAGNFSRTERGIIQMVLEKVYEIYPKVTDRVRLIEKVLAAIGRKR
jgi:molecular chaperone HtpG